MDRWQDTLVNDEGDAIDDLKASPVLDRYKTANDAMYGLIETKAKLSRSFPLPPTDATKEQRDEWLTVAREKLPEMMMKPDFDTEDGAKETWAMLGVPDEYKHDEVGELTDAEIETITDVSKQVGHTAKQHRESMDFFMQQKTESAKAYNDMIEADTEKLMGEWGNAYEQNVSITDGLANAHNEKYPDNQLGELNSSARIFMLGVANSLTSNPQIFSQTSSPNKVMTPTEARLEMDDMQTQRYKNTKMTKEQNQAWIRKYNKLVALSG